MIKILQYGLSENLGGIETYLLKLASNIDKSKFHFDFLILGENKPCFYDDLIELGCKFHFVTDRRKNASANIREISMLLDNEQYDIVHCNFNSLSYITPAVLAVKKNIPTIVHSRNAGIPTKKISRLLHWINYRRLPKEKIKKMAVSDYAGKWMFGDNSDVFVINNGIDIESYKFNNSARRLIRNEFKIKDSETLIVHTGAFREQKNHDFLIDIFFEFKKYNNDAKLMLVGSGILEKNIKIKVNDLGLEKSIIFTGNRSDISALLSAGDLFLFPSLYEGFPNSVIEAETSGLPCLISDTITREVLINDNCIKLSLDKKPKDWAIKLINLKERSNDRVEAYNHISEAGYSVNEEIRKIEHLYTQFNRES